MVPPSSWHVKEKPLESSISVAWNAMDPLPCVTDPSDGLSKTTVGALESMSHEAEAPTGSVLPAASTAQTVNVCDPSARPEYD